MQPNQERAAHTFSESLSKELTVKNIIEKLLQEHKNGTEKPVCEYILKASHFKNTKDFHRYIDNLPLFEKRLMAYYQDYCQNDGWEREGRERRLRIKGYYVGVEDVESLNMLTSALYIYIELCKNTNRGSVSSLYRWEDKRNEIRINHSTTEL